MNLYSLYIWKYVNFKTGHFSPPPNPLGFVGLGAELAVPCALLTQVMHYIG